MGIMQSEMIDRVVRDFRDEDRQTIIGMSIIVSAGRQARESLVATLVGRWGVMWPPEKDEYGKVIPSELQGRMARDVLSMLMSRNDRACSTFVVAPTPRSALREFGAGGVPPELRLRSFVDDQQGIHSDGSRRRDAGERAGDGPAGEARQDSGGDESRFANQYQQLGRDWVFEQFESAARDDDNEDDDDDDDPTDGLFAELFHRDR